MSHYQTKSNYKDYSFGSRDSFAKGTGLIKCVYFGEIPSLLVIFEVLEIVSLVTI